MFLCMTLLASCHENIIDDLANAQPGFDIPTKENAQQYEITYQYNENVIVFDEGISDYIEKVVADTIIYFSTQLPEIFVPEVNDIISCRIYEKLPYGLGNRVLSFDKEGSLYKCVTTSAALDEIFKVLDIDASIVLLDTISDGFYDDEGQYWETSVGENTETRGTIGSPNVLTINLGNYTSDTGAGFYVNGAFTVGAIATVDIDLGKKHSECSLELLAGINGEMGVKTSAKGYKKIFRKENLVNGVLAIGPVVLRPYVDIELGRQLSVEGNITTGFSKQFGLKAGIRNGKAYCNNTTTSADANLIKIFL